ncbi:MAG: L-serine ammonia-lyase, iron-sulfur-dependent, subunit alpha [Clostridiales bacterium]|nr:L-serine ammonia-lyase, iron-sulfur-dependent, subunit alpha [Roseburia sp.]MDD7635756.1 L-serine ammonia-lyase, iron-sulfur-dependent, subunit alpha [Clostridiales bacterium]MDY4112283.1 L-serine ammonia-lyase, iron-sulfur-dependent, subunit alpha [Roseburia sp.]
MEKSNPKYNAYIQILKEELRPAMGCTEPIALAYAAAVARRTLGELPDRVVIGASGSIIKNVKSVIVPNTNHLKGIPAAAAAGIIAGNPDKELEVISEATAEDARRMKEFMENTPISVEHLNNGIIFDILVTLFKGENYARVRIANYHTNIVLIEHNGEILKESEVTGEEEEGLTDRTLLNMEDIWDFINSVDINDIKEVLDMQMEYNLTIAEEGLRGTYGANIGKVLLEMDGDNVRTRAKAMAAAGSDARMNGCELPVVINSGSGNQGITVSLPVIVYAKELQVEKEKLYRALALSNLTAIHEKTPIGRLSAYCGAVNAGAGAGAGIAYLCGGGYEEVIHTVVNALAIVSGIVCDGAKASCAAKIASAVDAGILGYNMYVRGQQFYDGDGIVTKGVEATLKNVGRLGKEGMRETNEEIIKIMIGE